MSVILLPDEKKLLTEAHESAYSYLELGYLNLETVRESFVHKCVYDVYANQAVDDQASLLADIISVRMFMMYTAHGRNRPKLTPDRERTLRLVLAKSRYLLTPASQAVENNILVTMEVSSLFGEGVAAQAALSEFSSAVYGRSSVYTQDMLAYVTMRYLYKSLENGRPFAVYGPDIQRVFGIWERVYARVSGTKANSSPKRINISSSTKADLQGVKMAYDDNGMPQLVFEPEPKFQAKMGVACDRCGDRVPVGRGNLCPRCKALEARRAAAEQFVEQLEEGE